MYIGWQFMESILNLKWYKGHHQNNCAWQNQQNDTCSEQTQISLNICSVWYKKSLTCTQSVAKDPMLLHADSEDSDQTRVRRMSRLMWVFSDHFVGFVVLRFNYKTTKACECVVKLDQMWHNGIWGLWHTCIHIAISINVFESMLDLK